ncbi:hypothetical protein ACS0TY_005239 [Phlomoides rotata]
MEGVSVSAYRGIKGYWRRKSSYNRFYTVGRKRKPRVVQLGAEGSARRRRRSWRIKLTPRLKFNLRFSPKKLLVGIRDAYVRMMMKMASSRVMSTGYGTGFGGDGVTGFGMRPIKEYDEKMIVEIYKSIVMAQGQLVPRDAAWIGSEITCKR